MANIELVIKIPEEEYRMILLSDKTAISEFISKEAMMYAIKNGTPLPKGHGNLKDIDKIEQMLDVETPDNTIAKALKNLLESVPTIIEADKESEV